MKEVYKPHTFYQKQKLTRKFRVRNRKKLKRINEDRRKTLYEYSGEKQKVDQTTKSVKLERKSDDKSLNLDDFYIELTDMSFNLDNMFIEWTETQKEMHITVFMDKHKTLSFCLDK